jgi:Flp pilus assembly protein TadB
VGPPAYCLAPRRAAARANAAFQKPRAQRNNSARNAVTRLRRCASALQPSCEPHAGRDALRARAQALRPALRRAAACARDAPGRPSAAGVARLVVIVIVVVVIVVIIVIIVVVVAVVLAVGRRLLGGGGEATRRRTRRSCWRRDA